MLFTFFVVLGLCRSLDLLVKRRRENKPSSPHQPAQTEVNNGCGRQLQETFGYPSHAGSFAVLLRSYGPIVWRGGNVYGLITRWINRCTRQCYRSVQHLHVLPTIHHRSRFRQQCQAHACGMHASHASHNTVRYQTTPQ